MTRELSIVFRARVTWLVAAILALLVGHGFVLAVDLYSASSRSAMSSVLQTREMDPLAGVVRPTLGGFDFVLSLLGPLIAARSLSVEKERRTYGALCLAMGSTARVVTEKALASSLALGMLFVVPLTLFATFIGFGGHVDAIETGVALAGTALHALVVAAVALLSAAWTRTLAQAVTLAILASVSSWAIDVAEGFAALAWLGGASAWSIDARLLPFQRGIVMTGSVLWLSLVTITGFALALVGGSFQRLAPKLFQAGVVLTAGTVLLVATGSIRRGFDWSEERRASLPPPAVAALRAIPSPIAIDVFFDRDDSRRRQLESDALAKLSLARPDLEVRTPLDDSNAMAEALHGTEYGRLVVHVGDAVRETRSTSRRELTTLIVETAGRPLPAWTQPAYPGFPSVIEGARRVILGLIAYVGIPLAFALTGFALTRRRTIR